MYHLSYLFKSRYCVAHFLYCHLATSSHCYKYNVQQINKLTLKFLAKDPSIKSRYRVAELPVPTSSFEKQFKKGKTDDNWRQKRVHKLLFEKITEVIATSELGGEVISKGLFITKLHLTSSYLQVYWSSNIPENNEILADILHKLAPVIRHGICTQRVICRVPPVIFVRDEMQKLSDEVHKRLKVADLGDDFASAIGNAKSLDGDSLEQLVPPESRSEGTEVMPKFESNLKALTLRQDIFGVNRTKIMSLVKHKCPFPGTLVPEGSHELEPRPDTVLEWSPTNLSSSSRMTEITKWVKQYKKSLKKSKKKNRALCLSDGKADVKDDVDYCHSSEDELETMEDDLCYYEDDDGDC